MQNHMKNLAIFNLLNGLKAFYYRKFFRNYRNVLTVAYRGQVRDHSAAVVSVLVLIVFGGTAYYW